MGNNKTVSPKDTLTAFETSLGDILTGSAIPLATNFINQNQGVFLTVESDLDNLVQNFWKLEDSFELENIIKFMKKYLYKLQKVIIREDIVLPYLLRKIQLVQVNPSQAHKLQLTLE